MFLISLLLTYKIREYNLQWLYIKIITISKNLFFMLRILFAMTNEFKNVNHFSKKYINVWSIYKTSAKSVSITN